MATTPIIWIGHLIESASLLLFGWCWWEGRRQGKQLHIELLVAVIYGWLLEVLDMWIFSSYHYGPLTWWWAGRVPVYIPLLWAAIVHSSMAMSDRAGLPGWAKPFSDGLFAVLIDLAIDAIAIRLGLWHWGIPINEGWYGVPAGNLCAWMWVAASYGWAARLVRSRIEKRNEPRWHRLLIPVVSYTALFTALFLIGAAGRGLHVETQAQRLWMFFAHVVVFTGVVAFASRRQRPDEAPALLPSLFWNRWLMHISFFVLLVATPIWRQTPGLILLALATLWAEWLAWLWCEGKDIKPLSKVYNCFKKIPMRNPLFSRLVILGIALGCFFDFSACASSSPAVSGTEQRLFRRQSEVKANQPNLETCLAEAIASDAEQDADLNVAQSADAEATQLAAPDPSIAARHSQAAFQRCLQKQLREEE